MAVPWCSGLGIAVGLVFLARGGPAAIGIRRSHLIFPSEGGPGGQVLDTEREVCRALFPPGLLRRPVPMRVAVPKPEGTYRIFVFGESAAMGDPDPAFSFGRQLEALLRDRFPGSSFEVVNTAFTAINSHAILPMARECAAHGGDLWIVYMGNNELEGPFGAGALLGPRAPPIPVVRAALAASSWRAGQAWRSMAARMKEGAAGSAGWQGMKRLVEHPVPPDDPARERVYRNFEANVVDLLKIARAAQVPVVLSTVASNLRDHSPFLSSLGMGKSREEESSIRSLVEEAARWVDQGRAGEALSLLEKRGNDRTLYAEWHFQKGRALLAAGQTNLAFSSLQKARDLDALPLRADSRINGLIRTLGRTGDGVSLVDVEGEWMAAGDGGALGGEYFFEHVHFTFEGNYGLARAVAEAVLPRLPASLRARDRGGWAEVEWTRRVLVYSRWSELSSWEQMARRISGPPFTNQSTFRATADAYRSKLEDLRAGMNAAELGHALNAAREAVEKTPSDPHLATQLARLLEAEGNIEEAVSTWRRARSLLPEALTSLYELGRLALKQGKPDESVDALREVMRRRPEAMEAGLELVRALAGGGQLPEALSLAEQWVGKASESPEAWLVLGAVRERSQRTNEAMLAYREAASRGSESARVSASLEAARVLSLSGRFGEAAEWYRRVSLAQPGNAAARLNLADALAKGGQREEATTVLRELIAIYPQHWEARYLLGIELAMQQKVKEAEAEFTEVILLKPDFARAHLNLGVALAQQQRMGEALARFQEVLRLDPKNDQARQYVKLIGELK